MVTDRRRPLAQPQLLDAVLAIGGNLDLQDVLNRIAAAAATLADASYAALGVISDDGDELSQFLVVGVDDSLVTQIGSLPSGHGVLGELIRDPRPLRLHDLTKHPASFGFPSHHPAMHSFLGVPIRIRDTVFGNLYLTEKRGGGDFDEYDELMVQALATAAGVAIQNARLYDESLLRHRLMEAFGEVSTALLSGVDPEDVLTLIVRRAREVTGTLLTFAALPMGERRLLVEAADGEGSDVLQGRLLDSEATGLASVIESGRAGPFHDPAIADDPAGVAVPLAGPDRGAQGALVVVGLRGINRELAVSTLTTFAAQASVALELAERRREVERYAVLEDRDRIARDLHDLVIQRLFATGMRLEGATRLITELPEEAKRRVEAAVEDLDATIRELRSTIYGLQAPTDQLASLRARILQVVDAGTEQLTFSPSLRMDGLLDTLVPAAIGDHLLATLREALSNAARHASARHVEVVITTNGDELTVDVADDGVGMSGGSRRSGLANLESRAVQLGGALTLTSADGTGVRLSWRVPLHPDVSATRA